MKDEPDRGCLIGLLIASAFWGVVILTALRIWGPL
jgi:uncharacterized membrane protein